MAQLVVVKGPLLGKTFEIGDGVVMGRSMDCQVHLDDLTVSRVHARVTRTPDGYLIEDMHSGNGTFVGQQRIAKPTILRNNNLIGISGHVLKFVDKEARRDTSLGSSTVVAVDKPRESESSAIVGTLSVRDAGMAAIADRAKAAGRDAILKAHDRLRTIIEVSNAVQSEFDLGRLLERILESLFRVFPQADRGFVMLRDEQTGEMTARAARTRSGSTEEITVSKTLIREAIEDRVAILSADAMGDERFQQAMSIVNFQIRSMMCAPLIAHEDILGIIHVDTARQTDRFDQDDLELLTGVANQTAVAIANTRMHERLLMRDRMERDLQLAAQVQHSFLPERCPDVPGFEFAARYESALAVGGDFYDFIGQGPDRMVVVVGDVSGKGVPAALLMAKMTSDVRFFALQSPEPQDIVTRLNDHMNESSIEDVFVTLMLAAIDVKHKTLTITNAAHCPAILRRAAERDATQIATEGNFPLGVVPGAEFTQETYQLQPGDVVCFFTDGVTEAMNGQRDMYGFGRLEAAVANAPASAQAVLDAVLKDVRKYVGVTKQSDDLTLVCAAIKQDATAIRPPPAKAGRSTDSDAPTEVGLAPENGPTSRDAKDAPA